MGSACCTAGAKGDKFSLNHDVRKSASVHYVDVNQLPILPSSSTASLLKNQDEVDIGRLITTTMATTERNGHVNISNNPMPCSPTSLTTVPVSRRTRDREDDVDTSRLQSSSTTYVNGKHIHGYLEQVSDDTEYETAYSDFSDRIDELERTLVQEEPILMKTATQHHSPRFLIRPNNASCFHGDHARFVCCMTGSPRPDISWFASGKVIRPERNNRLKITDYGEDNNDDACALVSILDIVEVKFEDKGEYACVAINSQGQAFSSAQLDVEERDSGPVQQSESADVDGLSTQPKIETSDRDDVFSVAKQEHIPSTSLPSQKVQALVGSKASFFCPVEGEPLPEVKWSKDDTHITGNHSDDRITLRVEGSIHCLHIRDIIPSDAGLYVCSAANDNGMVLCVSLLEVQDSTGWAEDSQEVKQRTPMLVITEPEIFRQFIGETQIVVPSKISKEGSVVPSNNSNQSNIETFDLVSRNKSDEEGVKDVTTDTAQSYQLNSGEITNRNMDDMLNSVLSTYGPREFQQNNCDDRLSVTSNDGVTRTRSETNSSEAYVSAEGPRGDNDDPFDKKAQLDTPEGDNISELKHHKGSKRRTSRRNHLKSPIKVSHSLSPADKAITEFIDLDDVNGFPRTKSSRKKRPSSRRKKSPIHSKNAERVRLDIEKAEELTEKVDSCLDIIDDLLTLTSYDENENENETEEKLRQKLDTLVQKFGDSESDAGSLSSRRGTPSHRRKEKYSKGDLLHMSDSNGEYIDGSDVNINVSRIQSEGNIWGECSLEDSLKVMSELVGNIAVTVRDPGMENEGTTQAHQVEQVANGQEENINNNNNSLRKALVGRSAITVQKVKRTPLRDLLKQSLFSQELTRKRVPRRPLPVTRSLDSVDDITHIHNYDRKRRHSFGSLYPPRYSRPSRNPLLRTLSIRRRNRDHSTDSSSSDDDIRGRLQGRTILRRPRHNDNGQASGDCPSNVGSTDSLQAHQEDKFQQFPDGDRLSSSIDSEDLSDSSLEENDNHYPHSTERLQNLLFDTDIFPEHTNDQRAPHMLNGTTDGHEDKIENGTDHSTSCMNEDNSNDLQDDGIVTENSSKGIPDDMTPENGGNSLLQSDRTVT
ncbi:uncharacterized protein LOC121424958 isoform X2 [Lytechinus variegatus]|uniref:uncharacterized protein LOC121424958 isoform X2 n=1 Tax=Lytechinus variegatus TaxID=7654 RepID=UPI001BB0FA6C|nr:uncharacterized protein LOC121424958 isoform X2 [Lytechinus variegatus]